MLRQIRLSTVTLGLAIGIYAVALGSGLAPSRYDGPTCEICGMALFMLLLVGVPILSLVAFVSSVFYAWRERSLPRYIELALAVVIGVVWYQLAKRIDL